MRWRNKNDSIVNASAVYRTPKYGNCQTATVWGGCAMKYAHSQLPEGLPPHPKDGVKLGTIVQSGWFRDPDVKACKCAFCGKPWSGYEAVHADVHRILVGRSKHGLTSKYALVETVVRNTNNSERPRWARSRRHACTNEKCEMHISVERRLDHDGDLLRKLKRSIYRNKGRKLSRRQRRRAK